MPSIRLYYDYFRLALSFLTTLPCGRLPEIKEPGQLAKTLPMFPLIGLLLGLFYYAATLITKLIFPVNQITAALILGLAFFLTWGLHLDGVADTADGLMSGSRDREKIYAIMKDSRLGSMGALALIGLFMLKFAALTAVVSGRPAGLLVFPLLGRYAIVQLSFFGDYARVEGGLGANFIDHCRRDDWLTALFLSFLLSFLAAGIVGLTALALVIIYNFFLLIYVRGRLGGISGDILGFGCETSEALALLALAAFIS